MGAVLASAATPAAAFSAASDTFPLWTGGVPGKGATVPVEELVERGKAPGVLDRALFGISEPRMIVVRPARADGSAVLICPGGGYRRVVIDREGYEVAHWLAARGVTAFVLIYRLPAEGWTTGADTSLIDAQRAMRLIRAKAAQFGVDPARLAVMGFSAGGHLAADLAARFATVAQPPVDIVDTLSARPMLAAPIYPVIAMEGPLAHAGSREKLIGAEAPPEVARAHDPSANVPPDAPPHFLVHAEDDGAVPVGNSLRLREALKARGIAVETHLFETGGHGFGLAAGRPAGAWPQLFMAFASARGLVKPPPG
ncbi:alpha/beta hydrolase [Sandaracinobacter neustonicus]|nr:alpha/beta hydrolase [Sandaracinobacter neustonicus]